MTDNTSLAAQLETLAEKATPGPLMMYGEPDVGLRTEPFFGTPMKGGMHPLADWRAYDADLVVALWNCLPSIIIALRAADQRCAELEAENARLREAGQAVIDTAFDHYTARNGRRVSIEGNDGEKCWIVPFDPFEDLRKALENRDD